MHRRSRTNSDEVRSPGGHLRSNRALARALGVSETAVRKAEQEGRIQRVGGRWDVAAVRRAWETSAAHPSALGHPEGNGNRRKTPASTTMLELRKRRETIRIDRDRLRLEHERGALIPVSQVERTVTVWARAQREALQRWPGELAPELAAEWKLDEATVRLRLETAVREKCIEIAAIAFHMADSAEGVNGVP